MLHVRTDGKITFVVWTVIQEGYASERRRSRLCLRVKPKRRFPGRSVVGIVCLAFVGGVELLTIAQRVELRH